MVPCAIVTAIGSLLSIAGILLLALWAVIEDNIVENYKTPVDWSWLLSGFGDIKLHHFQFIEDYWIPYAAHLFSVFAGVLSVYFASIERTLWSRNVLLVQALVLGIVGGGLIGLFSLLIQLVTLSPLDLEWFWEGQSRVEVSAIWMIGSLVVVFRIARHQPERG